MPWHLIRLSFENYRTFREEETLVIRPLTVLIGRNSSGKSAIARLPLLLRRALSRDAQAPLEVDLEGHDFGASFLDLVHNRVPTRGVTLGATVSDGVNTLSLRATVGYWDEYRLQGVRALQVRFRRFGEEERSIVDLEWNQQGDPVGEGLVYRDKLFGPLAQSREDFIGLVPSRYSSQCDPLRMAFESVRYLGPFREHPHRQMRLPESTVRDVGLRGGNAARVLADDMLRRGASVLRRVGDWYREHLGGLTLDIVREGQSFSVVLRPPDDPTVTVNLSDGGVGLSQVLPIIVQHELDRAVGRAAGLDIVEQPELHLHPGAHGDLADLYMDAVLRSEASLVAAQKSEESGDSQGAPSPSVGAGDARFLIETHSENFVLRLRRRIAEGTLRPEHLALYWVNDDTGARPRVRQIHVDRMGNVDFWPKGVFAEDFEEVKAIRMAQRARPS